LVLFIITTFMIVLSFLGPWYNITGEMDKGYKGKTYDLHLTRSEIFFRNTTSDKQEGFILYTDDEFKNNEDALATIETTRYLAVIGLIFSIIATICVGLYVLRYISRKTVFRIGLMVAVFASIFTIIPSIHMMSNLPESMGGTDFYEVENYGSNDEYTFNDEQEFFGGEEIGTEENYINVYWGPAWSWWVSFISGVVCCLGSVVFGIYGTAELINHYYRKKIGRRQSVWLSRNQNFKGGPATRWIKM